MGKCYLPIGKGVSVTTTIIGYGCREFLRICRAVKPNFHEKAYQRGQENRDVLRTSNREMEMVTIEICDVNGKFSMPVEVTKVDKRELLFLDNPNYEETIAKNPHLPESSSNASYSRCQRVRQIENRECTKNWRAW